MNGNIILYLSSGAGRHCQGNEVKKLRIFFLLWLFKWHKTSIYGTSSGHCHNKKTNKNLVSITVYQLPTTSQVGLCLFKQAILVSGLTQKCWYRSLLCHKRLNKDISLLEVFLPVDFWSIYFHICYTLTAFSDHSSIYRGPHQWFEWYWLPLIQHPSIICHA